MRIRCWRTLVRLLGVDHRPVSSVSCKGAQQRPQRVRPVLGTRAAGSLAPGIIVRNDLLAWPPVLLQHRGKTYRLGGVGSVFDLGGHATATRIQPRF
jgi:hypothetical protein